jgi:hypothetical protein
VHLLFPHILYYCIALPITTTCQILLSRGVAGAHSAPPSPSLTPISPPLVSIFDHASVHIATVGSSRPRFARIRNRSAIREHVQVVSEIGLADWAKKAERSTEGDNSVERSGCCPCPEGLHLRGHIRRLCSRSMDAGRLEDGDPVPPNFYNYFRRPSFSPSALADARGRTMEREGSVDRSPARARRDVEELSIPGAVRVLQPSKNLTVEPQYWSTTPTPSNSSSVSIPLGFGGHRDSLALVHLPHKKRECLFTGPIIDNILQHVSHRDYLSLPVTGGKQSARVVFQGSLQCSILLLRSCNKSSTI